MNHCTVPYRLYPPLWELRRSIKLRIRPVAWSVVGIDGGEDRLPPPTSPHAG